MVELKYGNTRTYFIMGNHGENDMEYVLATHYHPDHMGLISELMKQGVKLLLIDAQKDFVHYSDELFARDRVTYTPIDESLATTISCAESRDFLKLTGISGEIIRTTSHSEDSVSLVLDDGDCFVGDFEPFEYIEAYQDNEKLKKDWEQLLSFQPKRILSAHRPEIPNSIKGLAHLMCQAGGK